jgi:hypothetical protein
MTTAKHADNHDDMGDFHLWLQRVGTLAKEGNEEARRTLWRAFNDLAWPLAKLAKGNPRSIDFDLFQGVLQHCRYMLNRGLAVRDSNALTYAYELTVELCDLINQAEKDKPRVAAGLKTKVLDWPTLERMPTGVRSRARSTELARMVFDDIRVYRQLLDRDKEQIKSRDSLTRLAETSLIDEATKFPEVLRLPKKLDARTYPEWWKVGKKILKSYWDRRPKDYKRDLQTLAGKHSHSRYSPGEERQRIYVIDLVKKAFRTLAESPSK